MTAKFALAQINPTVGDLPGNLALHREVLTRLGDPVDVIIFPECSLPGYPAEDLLLEPAFIADLERALASLAAEIGDPWVIVGTVRSEGGRLFNSAAVIHQGKVVTYRDKSLLPTYDIFDELRYFTPAARVEPVVLELPSGEALRLGLHICEDLWDADYPLKVCDLLGEQGVDLFVNISASPFTIDRAGEREELAGAIARSWERPYLYCNLVGGQDELVFDGRSLVLDAAGQVQQVGTAFDSDLLTVEFPLKQGAASVPALSSTREAQLQAAIVLGIRDYFRKTGHRQAVVGLSGGVDSSVVAVLAARALGPKNVMGIAMPSTYSAEASEADARQLAANLGLQMELLPIEPLRQTMLSTLDPLFKDTETGLAEENLQARLRGTLLMAVANKAGALLLSTGNKTELALGYATLYGDMAGALAPIGDLPKSDIYRLARFINEEAQTDLIPRNVLDRPPSAELRPDQVDPFDYEVVSPLVDELVLNGATDADLQARGYDAALIRELRQLLVRAEYKRRQAALCIRVTGKAFGVGRRYPIVNRYVG